LVFKLHRDGSRERKQIGYENYDKRAIILERRRVFKSEKLIAAINSTNKKEQLNSEFGCSLVLLEVKG
jgi:hypothetical protein